jgi:predicted PolB exonuclease-like 3'-5' exonuclease
LAVDIETVRAEERLAPNSLFWEAWKYKQRFENPNGDTNSVKLEESWEKRAALYSEFGRIVCISVARVNLTQGEPIITVGSFYGEDEKVLIQEFYAYLDAIKAKYGGPILTGHSIKNFDVPYVFQRSMAHRIRPHEKMDVSGLKPWEIDWILDTKELWQGPKTTVPSLLDLTNIFGMPSPKEDMSGQDVSDVWFAGEHDRVVAYCEKDATYQLNVLREMAFMPQLPYGVKQVPEPEPEPEPTPEPKGLLERLYAQRARNNGQVSAEDEAELIKAIKKSYKKDFEQTSKVVQALYHGQVPESVSEVLESRRPKAAK